MSAYDLFALHLMERETLHVDLEHRRRVLDRLAHERRTTSAAAPAAPAAAARRAGGLRRLLPGGA